MKNQRERTTGPGFEAEPVFFKERAFCVVLLDHVACDSPRRLTGNTGNVGILRQSTERQNSEAGDQLLDVEVSGLHPVKERLPGKSATKHNARDRGSNASKKILHVVY